MSAAWIGQETARSTNAFRTLPSTASRTYASQTRPALAREIDAEPTVQEIARMMAARNVARRQIVLRIWSALRTSRANAFLIHQGRARTMRACRTARAIVHTTNVCPTNPAGARTTYASATSLESAKTMPAPPIRPKDAAAILAAPTRQASANRINASPIRQLSAKVTPVPPTPPVIAPHMTSALRTIQERATRVIAAHPINPGFAPATTV